MVSVKQIKVDGGIEAHADTHRVAIIGATRQTDRCAGVRYGCWLPSGVTVPGTWPALISVGIECTGSFGAAVTRVIREAGIEVFEVNRPNRFDRRRRGKTDVFWI